MTGYVAIGYQDVAVAALLLVANGALSVRFGLGLERRIAVAAIRMVVQLSLIGLTLHALFSVASPWLTGAAAVIMLAFGGHEVLARQTATLGRAWTGGLGAASLAVAGIVPLTLAVAVTGAEPWYDPRYVIPLLGMILGNTLTTVGLALDRMVIAAQRERPAIEARLACGHSFSAATDRIVRDAVRGAMMPTINSMSAAGLVFLPGMMTGQILAGVEPEQAVMYQMLIMFLIAGGSALGVVVAVAAARRRLTDHRQRLRLDRIVQR